MSGRVLWCGAARGPLPMALVCTGKYVVLSRRAGVGRSGRPGRTQSWSPQQKVSAREPQRAQVPCRWEMCDFPDWVKPVGLAEWFLLAAWSWHQEADAWGLARCVLEDEAGRSLRVFEGSDSRASRGK